MTAELMILKLRAQLKAKRDSPILALLRGQISSDHLPQILSMLTVALFSLMKTPLLICLRRNSWRTFLTFGDTWLIPLILMMKASLGSAGT